MREAGLRSRWPRWPVTFAVAGVIIAGGADTIEALYFDGQAIECTGCKNAVNGN